MPKIFINEQAAEISIIENKPKQPKCCLMLAHGAGAGMDHYFLEELAHALAQQDLLVVRFNFPYKEQGKKLPRSPKPNIETVAKVADWCSNQFPDLPLFLAGKSYGGRISSQYLSVSTPQNIKGIIYYGFPLHATGKPGTKRAEHLESLNYPQLFIQGTTDKLASIELIRELTSKYQTAQLEEILNADHSFKIPKKHQLSETKSIYQHLAKITQKWIDVQSN
jgi:uncharacterized protein